VEPEAIVYPVRSILRGQRRVRFLMNEMTAINLAARQVRTTDHVFPYDYLVLALGSTSHFFGVAGAAEHAFQLKALEQAIVLRNHILCRFERALCEPEAERRRPGAPARPSLAFHRSSGQGPLCPPGAA